MCTENVYIPAPIILYNASMLIPYVYKFHAMYFSQMPLTWGFSWSPCLKQKCSSHPHSCICGPITLYLPPSLPSYAYIPGKCKHIQCLQLSIRFLSRTTLSQNKAAIAYPFLLWWLHPATLQQCMWRMFHCIHSTYTHECLVTSLSNRI